MSCVSGRKKFRSDNGVMMGRKHISRLKTIRAIPLIVAVMPVAMAVAQAVDAPSAPAFDDNVQLALAPFPRSRSAAAATSEPTTKPAEAEVPATKPARVPYVPEN